MPPVRLPLLAIAAGTGGLLTLMVLFNGQLAAAGAPLFASWTAHATGTVAALAFLGGLALSGRRAPLVGRAPAWAYLGGISGAVTVMLSAAAVNTGLALSGTVALGLAGQVAFGLVADRFGLFGLAKRRLSGRDAGAVTLILAGSALIVFTGAGT